MCEGAFDDYPKKMCSSVPLGMLCISSSCRRMVLYKCAVLFIVIIAFFSHSNIQHFCGYIKQLPSLEDKAVKIKKYNHAKKSRDLGGEDL